MGPVAPLNDGAIAIVGLGRRGKVCNEGLLGSDGEFEESLLPNLHTSDPRPNRGCYCGVVPKGDELSANCR